MAASSAYQAVLATGENPAYYDQDFARAKVALTDDVNRRLRPSARLVTMRRPGIVRTVSAFHSAHHTNPRFTSVHRPSHFQAMLIPVESFVQQIVILPHFSIRLKENLPLFPGE